MADFRQRFRRSGGAGTNTPQQPGGNVAVDDRAAPPPPPPTGQRPVAPAQGAPAPAAPAAPAATIPAATAPAPAEPAARRDVAPAPATRREVAPAARARQRDAYGGINWGAAFFGWLVAIGLSALLTGIIIGAGTAIGLTDVGNNTDTIGIGGGILLLVVSMIAYYCGGYVAGRMSRFDGARQGFGVWVLGLIITVAIAAAGWIFGDKYNVLDRLNLPRIPVNANDLTTGGLIVLGAIALGTLISAVIGGTVGRRYHDRVDRAVLEQYP